MPDLSLEDQLRQKQVIIDVLQKRYNAEHQKGLDLELRAGMAESELAMALAQIAELTTPTQEIPENV